MESYYYNRLGKSGQAAYHAMLTGLRAIAPAFPVPRLEPGQLSEIFLKLRLDHPEIFYAVRFTYRYYPQASSVEMVPEYLFEKSKIQEHQKAMAARIQKLTRPAMNLSEREKEQFVHDFICRNVRYDKLKKPYSHEIIGPLGQGVGVCEGIAKTVKALCDALGVWCMVALSEANPEQGVKYRHAWNIVKLDGVYYHLDATFDNTLGKAGPIRYDYFNLNDEKLLRDHEPLLYPAPACTAGDRFYYREKKLSFTKLEDVEKRAAQAIRKNQPLIFHWRGGPLTRNAIAELTATLETAARRKELHPRIGLNWPQAVFQVSFVSQTPEQELTEEQANEGETL